MAISVSRRDFLRTGATAGGLIMGSTFISPLLGQEATAASS